MTTTSFHLFLHLSGWPQHLFISDIRAAHTCMLTHFVTTYQCKIVKNAKYSQLAKQLTNISLLRHHHQAVCVVCTSGTNTRVKASATQIRKAVPGAENCEIFIAEWVLHRLICSCICSDGANTSLSWTNIQHAAMYEWIFIVSSLSKLPQKAKYS